jgi:hypothetical protein
LALGALAAHDRVQSDQRLAVAERRAAVRK